MEKIRCFFKRICNFKIPEGGSVGSGVVGGSVGTASGGIKSQTGVCKNANSSTAIKLWSFLPFQDWITTYLEFYNNNTVSKQFKIFLSYSVFCIL